MQNNTLLIDQDRIAIDEIDGEGPKGFSIGLGQKVFSFHGGSRFPVLEESDEGNPLSAGDGADEGDLEGNDLPNQGCFPINDELAQALDCELEILFGRKALECKL